MRYVIALLVLLLASPASALTYAPECETGFSAEDDHRYYENQLSLLRDNLRVEREVVLNKHETEMLRAALNRFRDTDERKIPSVDQAHIIWVLNRNEVWYVMGIGECFVKWVTHNRASARVMLELVRPDAWEYDSY